MGCMYVGVGRQGLGHASRRGQSRCIGRLAFDCGVEGYLRRRGLFSVMNLPAIN